MINNGYALMVIAVMAAVTFALRAVPFVASRSLQRFPLVAQLGRFLPPAIMTLLLVHTLVGSAADNPLSAPWAEISAALLVMLIQLKLKHPLLSILSGTALYVLLRN